MIVSIITEQEIVKPITVVCDICKKIYDISDSSEIREFEFIRRTGGYGSIFGNKRIVELDICQHCLKKIVGGYIDAKSLSCPAIYP